MKKVYKYYLPIIVIIIVTYSCREQSTDPIKIEEKADIKIQLITYPTIGSPQTEFKINLIISGTSLRVREVKYDLNDDQKYDTLTRAMDTLKTTFKNVGLNKITATVFFENGSQSCSTNIWTTEPQLLLSDGNPFYEPNIYNGNVISVTHGRNHQVLFVDPITFKQNYFFEGLTTKEFIEMHCSVPSFDGKKILYDNGVLYRFCYYDMDKNDKKIIDIPLKLPGYPIAQVIWSLDSKIIYGVETNIVKSFNLETNQINTIYNKGKYICVIPDQKDKLAILDSISVSQSKLIIFNLLTKAIEKEYEDIPFNAPFRMLKNNDRLYFDGKLAFYSLSEKKAYYMKFDELNLKDHMLGEADINIDGDKFILTTFIGFRAMYQINLPKF